MTLKLEGAYVKRDNDGFGVVLDTNGICTGCDAATVVFAYDFWNAPVYLCPNCIRRIADLLEKGEKKTIRWEYVNPSLFHLIRTEDVTGVSGTGVVAEGVQFTDGTVVLRWRGESPSTVVWDNLESAMKVHGHDGKTVVKWLEK